MDSSPALVALSVFALPAGLAGLAFCRCAHQQIVAAEPVPSRARALVLLPVVLIASLAVVVVTLAAASLVAAAIG